MRIRNSDRGGRAGFVAFSAEHVWIESQIKALLLAEKGVTSVNYRWQSVKNVVYIMGEAQSSAELDKVLSIVRRIKGVTKVVSHIATA